MDFLLPGLLVLPLAAAAVIVAVSSVRRRRRTRSHGTSEPVHRAQADSAATQSAAVHPRATGPTVQSGRERRGRAAGRAG